MKTHLYPRLAYSGIKRNKQLYYPYILTCAGMIFMYFIIASLAVSPVVAKVPQATTAQNLLKYGKYMIIIFALIFIFYSYSFVIRNRKKEFGLYNILGMGKRNIAQILILETLFSAVTALALGIISGALLYKLAELALVHLINGEVSYDIYINKDIIIETIKMFGIIFVVLFVFSLVEVRLTKPIDLLKSDSVGEKPPKANWIFGILGVIVLAYGYYIALVMEDPLTVLPEFFKAVGLVIIGTYLIFVAGSVVLCRILQKNKRYYYKPSHFISVSSMTYRMKRNGAGLASICILSTMVLVIMSFVLGLNLRLEEIINEMYPTDFRTHAGWISGELTDEEKSEFKSFFTEGLTVTDESEIEYIWLCGDMEGSNLQLKNEVDLNYEIYVIDLETYNELTGNSVTLADGEVLAAGSWDGFALDEITIQGMVTFTVKDTVEYISIDPEITTIYGIMLVTNDLDILTPVMEVIQANHGQMCGFRLWQYSFDVEESADYQNDMYEEKHTLLFDECRSVFGISDFYDGEIKSKVAYGRSLYSLFGGIFFLGFFLSLLFVLATVMIIYYKQITEGYEDAGRFDIMQKVGMTLKDIRKSINSQMRTVFLLPVIMAGLHMLFAFNIVKNIMVLFGMSDVKLFAEVTIGCFAVFVVIYAVVYLITSNAYFRIVSRKM